MRARAELTAEASRLCWRSDPPIVLRPTGGHRMHLVQAAGGPLGGDDLALDIRLGAGGAVQVCSAAATVVQASRPPGAARWAVTASAAEGASLDWRPEPTVVCDGAELHSQMRVALRRGARAMLREIVVLGRAGQRGGRFTGELTIELAGVPLLAHTLLLDGADPVLTGPAGTDGARVIGMLATVGEGINALLEDPGEQPGLRWACSGLEGPGWLLLALGDRVTDVSRLLDEATRQWSGAGANRDATARGQPGRAHRRSPGPE
ncbi:MAG TPA: urease accessory protein UreD [Pseudonocardiaceae bacterium]|nr:urease accessory protein UreD [Pseudonocardiaceae bacterium]